MSIVAQKLIAASAGMAALGMSAENAVFSFISFSSQMSEGRNKWKDEILDEWQRTFKMPRKMKKQRRKELNLNWSIANYDPFSNF